MCKSLRSSQAIDFACAFASEEVGTAVADEGGAEIDDEVEIDERCEDFPLEERQVHLGV